MPTYVYQCDKCGVQFERRQSVSDDPLKHCPECDGKVHRVFQPVGIVFKGSGWYCTDHRTKSPTALPGETKSNGNANKTSTDNSGAEATPAKTEPSKPASTSED
jgi:putative FmdB family regulatory protein